MDRSVAKKLQRLFETARRPDGGRWTLDQVAQATELSVSYVWRLRSGKATNPTKSVLERLASFFGVPVTYFIAGDTESADTAVQLPGEEEVQVALQDASQQWAAGNIGRAEEAARVAIEKASHLGRAPLIAKGWLTLARILARADRFDEARAALSSAFHALAGSTPGAEWVQAMLARSYLEYLEDHLNSAYVYAHQSLAAAEAAKGDSFTRYEVLLHVGTLARHVGHLQEAVTYLEQARVIAQQLEERYVVSALVNLGLALLDGGQATVALEHFQEALNIAMRMRYPIEVNRAQHNIGLAYEELGRWREAIESFTKSLGSTEALGDVRLLAYNHMELGWCYAKMGQREDALRHAYMAIALAEEHERPGDKARAHWHLGRVLAVMSELNEAASHYDTALQLMEQLELDAELAKLQLEYADLLAKRGEHVRAAELYRKAAMNLLRPPSLAKYLLTGPVVPAQGVTETASHEEPHGAARK
ncbi:tetratricopeptide repeat protein [Carboxydochorda subterranea]|uniref:Tetratricopeptide repeat protein n=1 Tax=Carboxydichorda subterranea TaxID=3109565 RepID=A0ABZ1BXE6_9FIRM|nr:tetratricopeptide repeat protein [Limnochorda sp. L945t]WRP17346.1 tetratricopeptide repeat protein [Limnochorda sp. L945t]